MPKRINTRGLVQAIKAWGGQFEGSDPVYLAEYVSDEGSNWHLVKMLRADGSYGSERKVRGHTTSYPGVIFRISKDRKVWGPTDWAIIATDETSYGGGTDPDPLDDDDGDGTAPIVLEPHGETHGKGESDQTLNLDPWQLQPVRVEPDTGLVVSVLPGLFFADGLYRCLMSTVSVDLTAYLPAVGLKVHVTLSIDSALSVTVTTGTAKAWPQAVDIALAPDGERALCAVLLENGDTSLDQDRFYADLRYLPGGVNSGVESTSGNAIRLYSAGVLVTYDPDDAGLAAALAAASSGDTLWIPPATYTSDYILPAGVTMVGASISDVIYSGQIRLGDGATLERLFVSRSKNDANTYYGVIGPDTGTAYLKQCWVSVTQAGGGSGYGVSCFDQDGDLQVYGGRVFGTTADARVN